MSNFKQFIYNDGKEKWQSFEYTIEAEDYAPWYYSNFSVTGYGADAEEAKEECVRMIKDFINELTDFVNKIEEGE